MTKRPSIARRVPRVLGAALGVAVLAGAVTTFVVIQSPSVSVVATERGAPFAMVNLVDVIGRVGPAVVSVQVSRKPAAMPARAAPELPEGAREFFEHFFGRDMPRSFGETPRQRDMPRAMSGVGSGFLIDNQGHIATNDHVVRDATRITVVLQNGERHDAKLVGQDARTDLALLKIDPPRDTPHLAFGDSDGLKIGEWVIALGNPFGLGHSATAGIVSARSRNLGAGSYDDFLQIDARINPGSSGGPVFNAAGEVVGVSTAIIAPNGVNVGIGFAIPSAQAMPILEQLRDDGSVTRGWLGVQIQPVDRDIADSLGMGEATGAIVAKVTPESPAERAGVEAGDVILKVGSERIAHMRDLPWLIAGLKPGAKAELTVWRRDAEMKLAVEIGDVPDTTKMAALSDADVLGMRLAANEPRPSSTAEAATGVVITEVRPESAAAKTGLVAGDIVNAVGYERVNRPADVVDAIEAAHQLNRKAVLLLVMRDGQERFVALPLSDA